MSLHRLFNVCLAIAIALTLALAFHLDEEPRPRLARTPEQLALDMCGPGAALAWKADGSLTCRRHDGKGRASVVRISEARQ